MQHLTTPLHRAVRKNEWFISEFSEWVNPWVWKSSMPVSIHLIIWNGRKHLQLPAAWKIVLKQQIRFKVARCLCTWWSAQTDGGMKWNNHWSCYTSVIPVLIWPNFLEVQRWKYHSWRQNYTLLYPLSMSLIEYYLHVCIPYWQLDLHIPSWVPFRSY